jgi:hypothetical protein
MEIWGDFGGIFVCSGKMLHDAAVGIFNRSRLAECATLDELP